MNRYDRIGNLHKVDMLDHLVTRRRSELVADGNLNQNLINEYLFLRAAILKDLRKVKTRRDLLKVFYGLGLNYYIKNPFKVSSDDLYDTILQDEELFNRP